MRRRRLHILIALLVLALGRILHDSVPTPTAASASVAAIPLPRVKPATRPCTDPTSEARSDWIEYFTATPTVAMDPNPGATTQPSDPATWTQNLERRLIVVYPDPRATILARPTTPGISAVALLNDPSSKFDVANVLWTDGGIYAPSGGNPRVTDPPGTAPVEKPADASAPLPADSGAPPTISATPPQGVISLPPTPAPAIGQNPSPEPIGGVVFLIWGLRRNRRLALLIG